MRAYRSRLHNVDRRSVGARIDSVRCRHRSVPRTNNCHACRRLRCIVNRKIHSEANQTNRIRIRACSQPGRVATLVDDPAGITWGCAYKLCGPAALDYLRQRECTLGGYITEFTKFYPRHAGDEANGAEINGAAFPALLYVATDANRQWLGDGPPASIARQIVECSGPSGHNVEYLLRLADFMRDEVDGADDAHLFELERHVRELLSERKIGVGDLMGAEPQRIRRDAEEEQRRPRSFEYVSRVPDVKLRCLNI